MWQRNFQQGEGCAQESLIPKNVAIPKGIPSLRVIPLLTRVIPTENYIALGKESRRKLLWGSCPQGDTSILVFPWKMWYLGCSNYKNISEGCELLRAGTVLPLHACTVPSTVAPDTPLWPLQANDDKHPHH